MHDNKPGYYDCVLLSKSVRFLRLCCAFALYATDGYDTCDNPFHIVDYDGRGVQEGGGQTWCAETT